MVGAIANAAGQAVPSAASTIESFFLFDIPAQPLAAAVDAYSVVTGLEAVFDSNLAIGRYSTAVKGLLASDVALRVLLEGTDLSVVYGAKSFAIVSMPSTLQKSVARPANGIPYLALVQENIERAFCRHPQTIPGAYRLAIRFSIGPAGEVFNEQVLSSTGDFHRDELITDLLHSLSIERPPPPHLPQPITMVVLPRLPAQTGDCYFPERRP